MKTIYVILVTVLLWVAASAAAATRDPDQHFFDQTLGDFTEELQLAREEGKTGILIMLEREECPFCHRMKTSVLNRVEVQDYFKKNFLIFPVDIEGDVEITDFSGELVTQKDFALKLNRSRATPVFVFFDLDGKLVTFHPGITRNPEEFLLLGEYVVKGAYKDMSFLRYKGNRKKAESH